MPRRKRHYVFCKKGLHLMSVHGRKGFLLKKRKVSKWVRRYCLACKQQYNRDYYTKHRDSK